MGMSVSVAMGLEAPPRQCHYIGATGPLSGFSVPHPSLQDLHLTSNRRKVSDEVPTSVSCIPCPPMQSESLTPLQQHTCRGDIQRAVQEESWAVPTTSTFLHNDNTRSLTVVEPANSQNGFTQLLNDKLVSFSPPRTLLDAVMLGLHHSWLPGRIRFCCP